VLELVLGPVPVLGPGPESVPVLGLGLGLETEPALVLERHMPSGDSQLKRPLQIRLTTSFYT
jgi:hypothetical protein